MVMKMMLEGKLLGLAEVEPREIKTADTYNVFRKG